MTSVLLPKSFPKDSLGVLPPSMTLLGNSEKDGCGESELESEVLVLGPETLYLTPSLEVFTQLKMVQATFSGVERIIPYIPADVTLCNTSVGVFDISVSEWVISVILASFRSLPHHIHSQRRSSWDPVSSATGTVPIVSNRELAGKRVLLVGYGPIGQGLRKRLLAFDAEVAVVAEHERDGVFPASALPELLPRHEIVVLLVALSESTYHMVNSKFLAQLPDGALVVNAGRGSLIDQPALVAELDSGRLSAALDVTEIEPLPSTDPLWGTPNCIITPHIAGATMEAIARAQEFVGDQLRRYASGQPLWNVRTERHSPLSQSD